MKPLRVTVSGIGAWAAGFETWPAMRSALLGRPRASAASETRRPTPLLLPAAERRRVPDGVAVALEVAREALAMAAERKDFDSRSMASVFASAHGDLAIVDYLCATLASDPTQLSPTRFHHSVHNAAAGYWSIATPSFGPSTALAAGDASFALGLLEAVTQVIAEARPVLLVVFDTPAVGLLARAAPNTALFGSALLLSPFESGELLPGLSLSLDARVSSDPSPANEAFRGLAASSPAALAVALLERLARAVETTVDFAMDAASTIAVHVTPTRVRTPADLHETIE